MRENPVFGLGDLVAAAFVELIRHGSHQQGTAIDRTAAAPTLLSPGYNLLQQ